MNRTAKFVAFSLVAIGLTFSYSVFALAVPDDIPHTLFVRMSLWSLTMLVLHALYSRLVNRRSLFRLTWLPLLSLRIPLLRDWLWE